MSELCNDNKLSKYCSNFLNTTILPLNPQENITLMFPNNLNTRILEKDYYITKYPCNN